MGEVKNNMKSTKKDGLFAKIKDSIKAKTKRDKRPPEEILADQIESTFAMVTDAIENYTRYDEKKFKDNYESMLRSLDKLIAIKENDFKSETTKTENRLKLAHLNTIEYHLNRSLELLDLPNKALNGSEFLYQLQYHLEGCANEAVEYENI